MSPGVVVHLLEAEPQRQAAVLRNVANLCSDLGPDVPVELVAHGGGVELVTGESGLGTGLADVVTRGVVVLACANTLDARDLTARALLPDVDTVPSGIGHLARRQFDGWAYVRP